MIITMMMINSNARGRMYLREGEDDNFLLHFTATHAKLYMQKPGEG